LAQGQPARERIALTMSRVLAAEASHPTSPAGVLTRAKEQIAEKLTPGDGNGSRE
jgi:hypothetical protein